MEKIYIQKKDGKIYAPEISVRDAGDQNKGKNIKKSHIGGIS